MLVYSVVRFTTGIVVVNPFSTDAFEILNVLRARVHVTVRDCELVSHAAFDFQQAYLLKGYEHLLRNLVWV